MSVILGIHFMNVRIRVIKVNDMLIIHLHTIKLQIHHLICGIYKFNSKFKNEMSRT
jgi:hypothetical protein